jgi:hypothetical protein
MMPSGAQRDIGQLTDVDAADRGYSTRSGTVTGAPSWHAAAEGLSVAL